MASNFPPCPASKEESVNGIVLIANYNFRNNSKTFAQSIKYGQVIEENI